MNQAAQLAAQGLAEIAKIDLLGTFYYHEVIWTLVGLLNDREAALRAVSFQALQPVHADALGYTPGMADRSKPMQRWTEWCEKTCGQRPF